MKKLILIAGCLIATLSAFAQPKKILFVGNSYVYTNNLPQELYSLALSGGDTIIFDSSAPGGYTFQQHTSYAPTLTKINAQAWDYVVLQEQSQMPSFPPSQVQQSVYPYAAQLVDLILANDSCTQPVFFMTWGRKYGDATNCAGYPPLCTFEGMQMRLRQSYLEMGDDNEAMVTPAGEAFKNCIAADSTINLYSPDNSHPSVAGTYLAACTFYATFYQTSPVGLSYTAGLNANTASFLQQIAATTVFDSLAVWNINVYTPQAAYTYVQNTSTNFQLDFNSTSSNASTYFWDFGDGSTSTLQNPSHIYLPGTYTVSLTVSDGCRSSLVEQEITISPLSGIGNLKADETTIYHANGKIIIASGSQILSVEVYDMLGKLQHTQLVNNAATVYLDADHLSKGIYLIKVIQQNKISSKIVAVN